MVQVQCKVGDQVTKGQVLVVLEAMKMEYPIAAPADGKVVHAPLSEPCLRLKLEADAALAA